MPERLVIPKPCRVFSVPADIIDKSMPYVCGGDRVSTAIAVHASKNVPPAQQQHLCCLYATRTPGWHWCSTWTQSPPTTNYTSCACRRKWASRTGPFELATHLPPSTCCGIPHYPALLLFAICIASFRSCTPAPCLRCPISDSDFPPHG